MSWDWTEELFDAIDADLSRRPCARIGRVWRALARARRRLVKSGAA